MKEKESAIMICPHCKRENSNEDATFCSYCRQPIGEGQPEGFQQSVYQQPVVYCSNCANPCHPNAVVCTKCGLPLLKNNMVAADEATMGLKVLSFLIPLIGLVLYCVNVSSNPKSAKEYGKMAIIGFVVSILCGFFFGLFMGLAEVW